MPAYLIEIYKAWKTRDTEAEWSNSYEAWQPGSIENAMPNVILPAVITAERAIHLDQVQFLRWTIRRYNTGGGSFDPAYAPNGTLEGTGARLTGSSQTIDLNTCYQTKFQSEARAYGKKAYRGCLREEDVFANDTGRWALHPASDLDTFNAAWAAYEGALSDVMGVVATDACLALYTRFQTSPRGAPTKTYGPWTAYAVSEVNILKIGNVKMDHGWYNRGP